MIWTMKKPGGRSGEASKSTSTPCPGEQSCVQEDTGISELAETDPCCLGPWLYLYGPSQELEKALGGQTYEKTVCHRHLALKTLQAEYWRNSYPCRSLPSDLPERVG